LSLKLSGNPWESRAPEEVQRLYKALSFYKALSSGQRVVDISRKSTQKRGTPKGFPHPAGGSPSPENDGPRAAKLFKKLPAVAFVL